MGSLASRERDEERRRYISTNLDIVMNSEKNEFDQNYSDQSFWDKIFGFALAAGKEVIEKALWLYYAAQSPNTPVGAKAIIYTALGYFIFPLDAIPDITSVVGYADDLGALAAAVAAVAIHIDENVKEKTRQKLKDWFGD
jgi:uncharacterized membrane protein YkvA (DUF1232 family)